MMGQPREFLLQLFESAVAAAQPAACLSGHWPELPRGQLKVLACGKAALAMAAAARQHYEERVSGIAIAPHTHRKSAGQLPGFTILFAGHPTPDDASVRAAKAALDLAESMQENDLLLVLLSGGSSSLLCYPAGQVSLAEKRRLTRQLLGSSATIQEINCVRKHLSRIKGGRLAAACAAPVVTLAISDVPGDDPGMIGSGPTVPDHSSQARASSILALYGIDVDDSIRRVLQDPASVESRQGTREGRNSFTLVASGVTALDAAARRCREHNIEVHMLGDSLQGDAVSLAREQAALARKLQRSGRRACILSGGETSLSLGPAPGTGGRNTVFALALAIDLGGHPGIWALAADTDGFDGVGGHAGGLVDPGMLERAEPLGLNAQEFLDQDNSAAFLGLVDSLLVTGVTHTNVNDFRAVLVLPD